MKSIIAPFKRTYANIRSNKQVCLASISSMAIALSILGLFLFIFVNLKSFLNTWSEQVQVIIYLQDGISDSQRQSLENLIRQNPQVQSMNYVSRGEAWNKFKDLFSEKSDFLKDLDLNPLPASYNIHFKPSSDRVEKIKILTETLKIKKGVESVEFGEKWIARFEAFMVFLRIFLLALGGLMAGGLILIISNTIKLSVYSRKDEIELMLLMGATPSYIKIPFVLEGILVGLLGSAISMGLVKCLHLYLIYQFQGSLESFARGIDFQFISTPYFQLVILVSVFIGFFGSYSAVNQFLRTYNKK